MIEYYECVESQEVDCFTIGKIYKIKNPKNLEDAVNFIDDRGHANGWCGFNHKHFKPSTLEAFNLQESIKPKKIKKNTLLYLIKFLSKLNIK
jgi:hypothetical protein